MGNIFVTIVSFVFVFGVLVFVHEFGHFLAAKVVGIRVERFYLGFDLFGLRLLRVTRGKTEYGIGVIPLGGYVKMAGFVDESLDTKTTGAPDEFMSKNTWQKIFAICAGVVMNLILGFVIYIVLSLSMSIPDQPAALDAAELPPIVGETVESMPAANAGMVTGAQIVEVDGQPVETWSDLTSVIHSSPGAELEVVWTQGDSTLSSLIVPAEIWTLEGWSLKRIGLIGISPAITETAVGPLRHPNALQAVGLGFSQTVFSLRMVFATVKGLVTAQVPFKEVAGPLGIARISGSSGRRVAAAVKEGRGISEAAAQLFELIAFFSVTLAFINILPVPALDGGHLAVIIVEGFRRRPLPLKVRLAIQWVGIVLIFGLFVALTYNDILR